jgi:hypothetical protein
MVNGVSIHEKGTDFERDVLYIHDFLHKTKAKKRGRNKIIQNILISKISIR